MCLDMCPDMRLDIVPLVQAHRTNHHYEGKHAINTHPSEFLCPLCKKLCNTLIPVVPPAARPAIESADDELSHSSVKEFWHWLEVTSRSRPKSHA